MAQKRKTNLAKRRKLEELYAKGTEIRFGPGPGEDEVLVRRGKFLDENGHRTPVPDDWVSIYVRPANPLEQEQAMRRAQAERSLFMLRAKKEENSDESVFSRAYVANLDLNELREYVLSLGENDRGQEAMRNVLAMDEWKDVDALQDALAEYERLREQNDGEEPEGKKWELLLERDREFGRQVKTELESLRAASLESLKMMSRDDLEERAVKRRIEAEAVQIFMDEYQSMLTFYCARDGDDHEETFFEDKDDLLASPPEVQHVLAEVVNEFVTSEREAKNSPRVESGSESSLPPSKPETSESSTPQEQSE